MAGGACSAAFTVPAASAAEPWAAAGPAVAAGRSSAESVSEQMAELDLALKLRWSMQAEDAATPLAAGLRFGAWLEAAGAERIPNPRPDPLGLTAGGSGRRWSAGGDVAAQPAAAPLSRGGWRSRRQLLRCAVAVFLRCST